jgi:hypothetical protein
MYIIVDLIGKIGDKVKSYFLVPGKDYVSKLHSRGCA